jgi:flagellar basal body-associated protein FliL
LGDISDFINTDEIDRLLGDDNSDFYREDEMSNEPLPDDAGFEDEDLSMISMDDIQRVLSEDSRDEPDEALLDDLNLEEIVSALEDDASGGEGDLISQDDIDRLLRSSGVQADEVPEGIGEGFQISREEMETILTDTAEDFPETRDEEIVRGIPSVPKEEDEDLPLEKPRSRKKLFIMAAVFLLLMMCAGAAGWYFLLRGGDDAPPVAGLPGAGSVSGEGSEGTLAPGVPGEPQVVSRLENFLISAPEGNDYAFVSMTIVLTIRGVKNDPLKGYETFYRKRIYDEMTAKLALMKGEKPVQRELRDRVRKTGGAILTEGVIDEVALENYRLM